jgi:hypothetical protein
MAERHVERLVTVFAVVLTQPLVADRLWLVHFDDVSGPSGVGSRHDNVA